MRCKDCSQVRGYPYKRSHLVALRPTKISALDPPSTGGPGNAEERITLNRLESRFRVALEYLPWSEGGRPR
jgi:hypothetical protein